MLFVVVWCGAQFFELSAPVLPSDDLRCPPFFGFFFFFFYELITKLNKH